MSERIRSERQVTPEEHRYLELRRLLEQPFRLLSRLEVEGEGHIAKMENPAFLIIPHTTAIDFMGPGIATKRFLRFVYENQKGYSMGALGTWMARFGGGIQFNKVVDEKEKIREYRRFLKEVFQLLDEKQIISIHPEGSTNIGGTTIKKYVHDITQLVRMYESRRVGVKVAIIPCGNEYQTPLVKRPWPINIDIPIATKLIVRFGQPLYPSQHPELTMDDYMRQIAKLSKKAYAPDQERTDNLVE